jgi:hypothetical protein
MGQYGSPKQTGGTKGDDSCYFLAFAIKTAFLGWIFGSLSRGTRITIFTCLSIALSGLSVAPDKRWLW